MENNLVIGYYFLVRIKQEEKIVFVRDKSRHYTSSSNEDRYLCTDAQGHVHIVWPSDLIRIVSGFSNESPK